MQAHFLYADGRHEQREMTAEERSPSGERKLVKDFLKGYPEEVWVLFNSKRSRMFVDEDGHGKGLPYNEKATEIYRTYSKQIGQENDHWIAGDAMVLEGKGDTI